MAKSSRFKKDFVVTTQGHEPVAVYDNGGKTADRYTVVLLDHPERGSGMYEAIGLSSNPSHPQGFSQYTSAMKGSHLGKKILFGDLPENVRKHVRARLAG